jgi:hypothetical protein
VLQESVVPDRHPVALPPAGIGALLSLMVVTST